MVKDLLDGTRHLTSPDGLRAGGHGVDDELDPLSLGHADLQQPATSVSPDQHDEIADLEHTDRVTLGMEHVIVLDLAGKQLSSEAFSKEIDRLALSGKSDLVFVIGGSLGLSQAVLDRADFSLSFSKMTFPHQLMKVILL